MTDAAESAGALIDFINDNAVMSPIGTVEKLPRRRDLQIGTGAGSAEILRQR
jgi:hypothetical protein